MTEVFPDSDMDRELIPCESVPFPNFTLYRKVLENVEFELTQVCLTSCSRNDVHVVRMSVKLKFVLDVHS